MAKGVYSQPFLAIVVYTQVQMAFSTKGRSIAECRSGYLE